MKITKYHLGRNREIIDCVECSMNMPCPIKRKNLIRAWFYGVLSAILFVLSAVCAYSAEPKSIDDLLKDRAEVRKVLTGLTKSFDADRDEFNKLPAVKDYNTKLGKLRQANAEAEQRLRELDALIAETVAKERVKSK